VREKASLPKLLHNLFCDSSSGSILTQNCTSRPGITGSEIAAFVRQVPTCQLLIALPRAATDYGYVARVVSNVVESICLRQCVGCSLPVRCFGGLKRPISAHVTNRALGAALQGSSFQRLTTPGNLSQVDFMPDTQ
jgi:hypothetical protein